MHGSSLVRLRKKWKKQSTAGGGGGDGGRGQAQADILRSVKWRSQILRLFCYLCSSLRMSFGRASPISPAFLLIPVLENCSGHPGALLSKARKGKNSHTEQLSTPSLDHCSSTVILSSNQQQPPSQTSPNPRAELVGPCLGTHFTLFASQSLSLLHCCICSQVCFLPWTLCVLKAEAVSRLCMNSQHPAQCQAQNRSSVSKFGNGIY